MDIIFWGRTFKTQYQGFDLVVTPFFGVEKGQFGVGLVSSKNVICFINNHEKSCDIYTAYKAIKIIESLKFVFSETIFDCWQFSKFNVKDQTVLSLYKKIYITKEDMDALTVHKLLRNVNPNTSELLNMLNFLVSNEISLNLDSILLQLGHDIKNTYHKNSLYEVPVDFAVDTKESVDSLVIKESLKFKIYNHLKEFNSIVGLSDILVRASDIPFFVFKKETSLITKKFGKVFRIKAAKFEDENFFLKTSVTIGSGPESLDRIQRIDDFLNCIK